MFLTKLTKLVWNEILVTGKIMNFLLDWSLPVVSLRELGGIPVRQTKIFRPFLGRVILTTILSINPRLRCQSRRYKNVAKFYQDILLLSIWISSYYFWSNLQSKHLHMWCITFIRVLLVLHNIYFGNFRILFRTSCLIIIFTFHEKNMSSKMHDRFKMLT